MSQSIHWIELALLAGTVPAVLLLLRYVLLLLVLLLLLLPRGGRGQAAGVTRGNRWGCSTQHGA
jgi:hypothetical protein